MSVSVCVCLGGSHQWTLMESPWCVHVMDDASERSDDMDGMGCDGMSVWMDARVK